MIQRDIEDVEVSQLPSLDSLHLAVEEKRHRLLAHSAMRAQGRIEPGEVMALRAGAEDDVARGHDHEIAHAVGRKLEARARLGLLQGKLDARELREPLAHRRAIAVETEVARKAGISRAFGASDRAGSSWIFIDS